MSAITSLPALTIRLQSVNQPVFDDSDRNKPQPLGGLGGISSCSRVTQKRKRNRMDLYVVLGCLQLRQHPPFIVIVFPSSLLSTWSLCLQFALRTSLSRQRPHSANLPRENGSISNLVVPGVKADGIVELEEAPCG
jgi:hypothetical protein